MPRKNKVAAENLEKKYGTVEALKNVSFEAESGEVFGIIGPDGAGKTTLFRILTTLLLADKGSASVCGFDTVKDYKAIRNIIGYMPGKFSLYQDLSVEENLTFFATVFNTTIAENYALIKDIYVQLEPFKTRRAGALSGGMKQKLALCCALIHKPEVLFLDEPTTGVDPVSRFEFWEMLASLKKQGITIVVSTPYMDEAERCTRIALMRGGKFLTQDTPQNIQDAFALPLYRARADDMFLLLTDIRSFSPSLVCYPFGDFHHLVWEEKTASPPRENSLNLNELRAHLEKKGHRNLVIEPAKASIEDCFLNLKDGE